MATDYAALNAAPLDEGQTDTLAQDEPVTHRVPRAQRGEHWSEAASHAEPVAYRVPHGRRQRARAEDRHANWSRETVRSVQPAERWASLPPRALAGAMERAMCDLVADPTNDITRITVVGSSPEKVAALEALAAEWGLSAVAATSPSLQRGWVRLSPPADERAQGRQDTGDAPMDEAHAGFARRLRDRVRAAFRVVFG